MSSRRFRRRRWASPTRKRCGCNTRNSRERQPVGPGTPEPAGTVGEVFAVALGLGLTSFGGPIAHIGYFERAYVERRKWLDAQQFAGLVALCQLIPGPASSQLGYLIGLRRAGWAGALAAWLGFTLPSALLMFAFALVAPRLSGPLAQAGLHGLKLVAVVIVAQAIVSMARSLCPDWTRRGIALTAWLALLALGRPGLPLAVLGAGAVLGVIGCRQLAARPETPLLPLSRALGTAALAVFLGLLGLAFLAGRAPGHGLPALAALFYRAGALVFGGGHVVLPLLREALVPAGWLNDGAFLSGYGAAQAMPGPLFTFAAYLGAAAAPAGMATAALWAVTALVALFLPGLLVALAGVSLWSWLGHHAAARGALAGANAAVVGVLGAAFCTPVWTSAVLSPIDVGIVATAFLVLMRWRAPPIAITGFCVLAALVLR